MAIKYTDWPQNIPIDHKIYQHIPLQDSPKFTQIFRLKIYHLATLIVYVVLLQFSTKPIFLLILGKSSLSAVLHQGDQMRFRKKIA
jgi:hypothetical protein